MDNYVVVQNFVAVAGGFVENPESANDVDVIIRADYDGASQEFSLPAESLMLVVRKAIQHQFKIGKLPVHLIFNATGPHSDFIPVADLVLRFREGNQSIEEVKATDGKKLSILFLGTGPAEPVDPDEGEGRSNTSTAIAFGNELLVIDAPDGVGRRLSEFREKPTAVLITHRHSDAVSGLKELGELPAFGPEQLEGSHITVVRPLEPFQAGEFRVLPIPVQHSDVSTFAYRISTIVGYPTILVAHDIAELNSELLMNMGDIVIFDGAGWGQKIGNGHLDILEALPALKAHGANIVYLTQIGRLVPPDARKQLPEWAIIAHDGMRVELGNLQEKAEDSESSSLARQIAQIADLDSEQKKAAASSIPWPAKPAVPFYMEHFSSEQMWESWGKEHQPFYVEPKWNGWRIRIDGINHRAFTESEKDIAHAIPDELFISGTVLDGELLFERDGRIVPRHELPAAMHAIPKDWKPVPKIFDVLVHDGKPIADMPYRNRREILEKIVPEQHISPAVLVSSPDELAQAFRKMGFIAGSEGIVAKTPTSTLAKGGLLEWSKVKRMLEVVVVVVGVEQKKNGFAYVCRWKDGPETGKTMVTKLEAKPGDTLTVIAQELVLAGGSLRFQNAVVTGVNEREAMTLEQGKRLAERFTEGKKYFYGGPTPFAGFGGKARLAIIINSLVPAHTRFVEPFVGSGRYFFRHPKVAGVEEVIADIDPAKILAFKALQQKPGIIPELVKAAQSSGPFSDQERLQLRRPPKSLAEALLAAIRIRIYRRGFDSYRMAGKTRLVKVGIGTYLVAALRLRNVKILRRDAFEVIKQYDSDTTFFYFDPPYPETSYKYQFAWDLTQFIRFAEFIKKIRGKFIFSCSPAALQAARKAGFLVPKHWRIIRVKVWTFRNEPNPTLLILNYKPSKGEWLKSIEGQIIRLPSITKFTSDNWKQLYEEWCGKVDEAMSGGKKALPPESIREDEPSRAETARAEWEKAWFNHYPRKGGGRFVIQRHIRGIPEKERGDPPEALAERHSVHLDIRFTAGDGKYLFGFTVFVPEDSDDPLKDLASGKPLQCTPKLPQPLGWLDVGVGKPTWSEPGGVGSTSRSYARFDAIDSGRYAAGTWNRHSVEAVFVGKTVRGRFIIQQIRPGTWVIKKVDGKPIAQRYTKEQIADRLSKRGHKLFIYRDPTTASQPETVTLGKKQSGDPSKRPVILPTVWAAYLTAIQHLTNIKPMIRIIGKSWAIIPVTNAFADLTGDIVPASEIKRIAAEKPKIPLLLAHSNQVPLGTIVDYRRVGRHLFGIAHLNDRGKKVLTFIKKHPAHSDIAPLGWGTSIGFRANRSGDVPHLLHNVQLLEVSILPIGRIANPWTGIVIGEE